MDVKKPSTAFKKGCPLPLLVVFLGDNEQHFIQPQFIMLVAAQERTETDQFNS